MAAAADEDGAGPPHPRDNTLLLGHAAAEAQVLSALAQGRLAHGWLITGPRGVGKATLAYRIARYLLSGQSGGPDLFGAPPDSLAVDSGNENFRQVAAGAHPDLSVVEREADTRGRMRSVIAVDQIRRLGERFALTSASGSWRIAIVDGAEEMNPNAANALLKLLEEPPPRSLLLLVSHAPGRLLPTIRSRCRQLALRPLSDALVAETVSRCLPELPADQLADLAALADGSPGRALRLAALDGLATYAEIQSVLAALPVVDFARVHDLGDKLARSNQEPAYRAWLELLGLALTRLIRIGAMPADMAGGTPVERENGARLARLAPLDRWVELWEKVTDLADRADSVNLDRKQVIFNTFVMLEATARRA